MASVSDQARLCQTTYRDRTITRSSMNLRRRILCLFALVISFALAGCGGGSPTPSSSPPPGPGAVKEADKKAKNSPQAKKGLEMPPPID